MPYHLVTASSFPLADRLAVVLPQVVALEQALYPATEAASPARLEQRLTLCADLFVLLLEDNTNNTIHGFACGTRGYHLATSQAMATHDSQGPLVLLHSVAVRASLQRQGWALRLLHEFCSKAQPSPVRLICKPQLVGLYTRAGFSVVRASPVVHGADQWLEMERRPGTLQACVVDAFASRAFEGNPAGVVLLRDKQPPTDNDNDNRHMEKKPKTDNDNDDNSYFCKVAREINAPETAFVRVTAPPAYVSSCGGGLSLAALVKDDDNEHILFNDSLACIAKHFVFDPKCTLRVGDFQSALGQNVGSLKTLAFALLVCGLDNKQDRHKIASLWREHYDMVLAHPDSELDKHLNIRYFLAGGEVVFSEQHPVVGVEDVFGLAFLLERCVRDDVFAGMEANLAELLAEHAPGSKLSDVRAWARGEKVSIPVASAELVSLLPLAATLPEREMLRPRVLHCDITWFTPSGAEVDLCGHATLAAAHALFHEMGPIHGSSGAREFGEIHFSTQTKGTLVASRSSKSGLIELDFPLVEWCEDDDGTLQAEEWLPRVFPKLNVQRDVAFCGRGGGNNVLLELTSRAAFDNASLANVDLAEMKQALGGKFRGVSVTVRADKDEGADFLSRFFAPMIGIDEDPVTGSAHCYLAKYWADKKGEDIVEEVVGLQHSQRGVGRVVCRICGPRRVKLIGAGQLAWKGEVVVAVVE